MGLVDSPELKYYEDGKPPDEELSPPRKNWPKFVIVALLVTWVAMVAILILTQVGGSASTGNIEGQVVNTSGTPMPDLLVYVDGDVAWAITDAEGYFTLAEITAGSQMLVIGVTPQPPQFIPVDVPKNGLAEVGQVTLEPQQ